MTAPDLSPQINLPFAQIGSYGHRFLEEGLAPEIGLNAEVLEATPRQDFALWAERFADVQISLHAPFLDLTPGGLDPAVVEVTRGRLLEAASLAPLWGARHLIVHNYYDEIRYGLVADRWLATAVETWRILLEATGTSQTVILIENVYETDPFMIRLLLEKIGHPRLGLCFDAGHHNVFSQASLDEWLDVLGPWLKRLHLHDNDGSFDQHLGLGRGTFDFKALFDWIRKHGLNPAITLEPHRESDLEPSLAALGRLTGDTKRL